MMHPNRFAVTAVALAVVMSACAQRADAKPDTFTGGVMPQLPRESVDTTLVPSSGRTFAVPPGGDFQDALDEAQLGDTIVLQAGAVYKGPFTLPDKKGSGWITIRSSAIGAPFPTPGIRVHASHASLMPKLVASGGAVITADKRAHHYRFIGIEMKPTDDTFLYAIMLLGNNKFRSVEDLPHHIIIDRCYLHGDMKKGTRRGVAMNGRHLAVIDSYLSDFKEEVHDTQAVAGWGGSGPFKIVNNFLEASGENLAFGGGDPIIRDLVPSDIEIRNNYAAKPLAWKPDEPDYDGSHWRIKLLFEIKNARRAVIDGNIFEYNWQTPGYGFGMVFTVRNEEGNSPWAVIEDITVTNNIVRHTPSAVYILGFDNRNTISGQSQRILIKNNLFDDIGGPRWGGQGKLFQVLGGAKDVTIEHNTGLQTGYILVAEGQPNEGLVYRYNITPHNQDGITGFGTNTGNDTLQKYYPGAVVRHNVIVGGDEFHYPEGNFFPSSMEAVRFANLNERDYRLSSASGFATPESGKQPGVDMHALCTALGAGAKTEKVCKTALVAGAAP